MAESRLVPTTLLTWPEMTNLLPDQKLIMAYLWFNRFTKTCGCYEFPRQLGAVELSISLAELDEALNDFKRRGLIDLDEKTGEVYVLAWPRFHKFKNIVQQVMYWTSVGQIQSERLIKIVFDKSINIPMPGHPYKSMIYDPTVTATVTSTATATKPESRGGIPEECLRKLQALGYPMKKSA